MTSSSEQTTALIAEARAMGTEDRTEVAAMIDRLADALEAQVAASAILNREWLTKWNEAREYADTLERRVVSTVAELEALPEGSVVRCDDAEEIGMNIAERRKFGWVHVGADFEFTSAQMVDGGLSYTVLWVGGTE